MRPRCGVLVLASNTRIKMTTAEGSRLIEGADTQMKADAGQGGGEREMVKEGAKVDLRSKER